MIGPHDTDAEEALLGGMMSGRMDHVDPVLAVVTADDFTGWRQSLFMVLAEMRRNGDEMTRAELVMDAAVKAGVGDVVTAERLIPVVTRGIPGGLARLADTVVRAATARRVMAACVEVSKAAQPGTVEASELVLMARDAMAGIDAPLAAGATVDGLSTVDAFLEAGNAKPPPWVVPGLLRAGWRCLVVAPEGVGKSTCARQIAIAAAQGVHPFTGRTTQPVRTLIVDLENPDDAIVETCKPITAQARTASANYDDGRAWLWRQPAGIDLRTRADRAKLERVIADTRPDLVALGPLYKAYRSLARESDEGAAGEVQAVLDDLRTRYGFALLMEHHAPKASGGTLRDLVPYGSSLWLRWPELGIKLLPVTRDGENTGSLDVGRFRQDRMLTQWPDRLDRGGRMGWPWIGYYENGIEDF